MFHSRLVLKMTAILILSGAVLYWLLEFRNTSSATALGTLPWYQQPFAALFQSVSTRTAGFNSIDQMSLADSSKFLTVALMFIGAAPASTGGGIKVTTMATVASGIISDIRRQPSIIMSKHYIRKSTARRASTIFALSLLILLSATVAISILENEIIGNQQLSFLDIMFEVGSAFCTVGLTAFGTPILHLTRAWY